MAGFFSGIMNAFSGGDKSPYELADICTSMRNQVLQLSVEDVPSLDGKPVWAVLMETGYEGAAVTVITVAEGTASLYFSNGGGIIGLGQYENVRPPALALISDVNDHLSKMSKTEEFRIPQPGETIFYIVTPNGVFTHQAKEDDLGNKRDKLYPLFYKGHELITQMRITDEKRRAEQ